MLSAYEILSSKYRTLTNVPIVNSSGTGITVTENVNGSYSVANNSTISLIVTTDGSGSATVNLTPYSFAAIPVVNLTCVNSSTSTAYIAQIASISTTSLTITSFRTQPINLLGGNPVTTVGSITVHIGIQRI